MITVTKLQKLYDKLTDLILEVEETLIPDLEDERETIEQRASDRVNRVNRVSGELTECGVFTI